MVHWSNPTIRMIHLVGSVVDRKWDLGNILIEQTRSMILRFACTYMWVFGFTRLERIPWSIPNPLVGSMSKISNAKDYNSMYIDTRPNFSFFFWIRVDFNLISIFYLGNNGPNPGGYLWSYFSAKSAWNMETLFYDIESSTFLAVIFSWGNKWTNFFTISLKPWPIKVTNLAFHWK